LGTENHDYWSTVHGRNSYDNLGAAKSYVHLVVDFPRNTGVMILTEWNLFDVLTSIDVAAHELDMLFVKKTANLATKRIRSHE
jgi:Zn-dependent metalloprotease